MNTYKTTFHAYEKKYKAQRQRPSIGGIGGFLKQLLSASFSTPPILLLFHTIPFYYAFFLILTFLFTWKYIRNMPHELMKDRELIEAFKVASLMNNYVIKKYV